MPSSQDLCFWLIAWLSIQLAAPAGYGADLPGVVITSANDSVTVKGKARKIPHWVVTGMQPLELVLTGPQVLELQIRALFPKADKGAFEGFLIVERDGTHSASWEYEGTKVKDARVQPKDLGIAAQSAVRHLDVPEGDHNFTIKMAGDGVEKFAVGLKKIDRPQDELLIRPEEATASAEETGGERVESEEATADEAEGAADDAPEATASDSATAYGGETVVAESSEGETTEVSAEAAAAPGPEAATSPAPGGNEAAPGSVGGATRALADIVARGFETLGRQVAFYRLAVPTLAEEGEDVKANNLGSLIAELIAAELARREPFVVVERERLDQIMKEHRLQGLGIVDEGTAAEFGKVMGAQSILSGTVSEAGPKYVVTVRMIEVETGAVLTGGSAEFDRDGLIALSSDAVILRSRIGAVARSLLLPGWGQVYNRQPIKGYLVMGVSLGLLVAVGLEIILGQLAVMDYENPSVTDREALRTARTTANARFSEANYLLIGFGVSWSFAVLDALIFGVDSESVELESGPAEAGLRLTF